VSEREVSSQAPPSGEGWAHTCFTPSWQICRMRMLVCSVVITALGCATRVRLREPRVNPRTQSRETREASGPQLRGVHTSLRRWLCVMRGHVTPPHALHAPNHPTELLISITSRRAEAPDTQGVRHHAPDLWVAH